MPTPDADDIVDATLTAAEENILSSTVDGTSATAHSLKELRETADWAKNRANVAGASRGLIFTKLQPPGAS